MIAADREEGVSHLSLVHDGEEAIWMVKVSVCEVEKQRRRGTDVEPLAVERLVGVHRVELVQEENHVDEVRVEGLVKQNRPCLSFAWVESRSHPACA